jgi:hypothetical protein
MDDKEYCVIFQPPIIPLLVSIQPFFKSIKVPLVAGLWLGLTPLASNHPGGFF